jgi:hypothetical protein
MAEHLALALAPVVELLEELEVVHYVSGSVASMTHGEKRDTSDVDIVANLRLEHVEALESKLSGAFYVDGVAIRKAIRRRESFNILHLETFFKVDIFPLKQRPYDLQAARRVQKEPVDTDPPVEAYLAQPEDILLAKIEWFRLGGGVSDRQWRDILGIVKMQCFNLDFEYLEHWAREINVADLLEKALDDAGLKDKETINGDSD